jgi:Holliday junction resolvase RusA-like endonuclease
MNHDLLTGPVIVDVEFRMPRPKSHYIGGVCRPSKLRMDAPRHHAVKPDATKLWRSTEDALTGVIWVDDAQVVDQRVTKTYADGEPGATILVWRA